MTHLADRPICVFDLETTSPDPETARIVTFAIGALAPDGSHDVLDGVVDPGIDIPVEASAIHGWTTERVRAHPEALAPRQGIDLIVDRMIGAHRLRYPVVAYNARFDFTVLAREMARAGVDVDLAQVRVVDPLVIDKALDKYRKGSRRLGDTCGFHGIELDDWHTAAADAIAAGLLAQKLMRGLPGLTDADAFHQRQVRWAAQQASSFQSYLRRSNPHAVIEGAWPLIPMGTEAPS